MTRLEAATLRLEDIASSTIELPQGVPALTHTLASPPPGASPTVATPAAPAEPVPESIEEFDAFINQSVKKYEATSKKIGGVMAEQVRSMRLYTFCWDNTRS
jgi:adenylyl cyclase-associated protein